jgi:hypothetical protein
MADLYHLYIQLVVFRLSGGQAKTNIFETFKNSAG